MKQARTTENARRTRRAANTSQPSRFLLSIRRLLVVGPAVVATGQSPRRRIHFANTRAVSIRLSGELCPLGDPSAVRGPWSRREALRDREPFPLRQRSRLGGSEVAVLGPRPCSFWIWRRGGDSNPRHPFGVKLLSRQPCSATPAPLRGCYSVQFTEVVSTFPSLAGSCP